MDAGQSVAIQSLVRAADAGRRALAPRPTRRRVAVRLYLPLTPIALLLAPFALLLALLCLPIWPLARVNPFAAAIAIGRLLLAMGGTEVRVDAPSAFVRIRIF